MKYLIVGSVILNDMLYADGSTAHGYLGGTIYSVNGVKPWEDDLLFITKTGPDYMKEIGSYLTDNNLSTDGIFPTLRKTIYSQVEYKPSGEWFEYSIYDDYSFEDWAKESRFKPEEVLQFCTSDTRGMYMEMGGDYKGFLEELADEKGHHREMALYNIVERLGPQIISGSKTMYKGVSANVDFYSGFLYQLLNIPVELFTPLFAIARITGWSAHRMEELINGNKIIRPAYKAVGGRNTYVPLMNRK